jgi:hypothetical protein
MTEKVFSEKSINVTTHQVNDFDFIPNFVGEELLLCVLCGKNGC